jgi:hypothetical protein
MEDKRASLSQDESFSDSGNAWGRDNRGCGADTCLPILPVEKPRAPWLQPHTRKFLRRQCVCCWSAVERKIFSLQILGRSQAASGGTGPCEIRCQSRRTRWDAINTTPSCLRIRLKPAPAWLARTPGRLNFFSAGYNELLALLSRDMPASDWLCA